MEEQNLKQESADILVREERCRKSLKTVTKAIVMRLFVTALLVWVVCTTEMVAWVVGLMLLVAVINLTGLLPLLSEWKNQRGILKDIIAEDETE